MDEPEKYSAEWLRKLAIDINAYWLDHHVCSICGVTIGYQINLQVPRGREVRFHSSCDCARSPSVPSSFELIALWLADQKDDATRDRLVITGLHGMRERPKRMSDPYMERIMALEECLTLWMEFDSQQTAGMEMMTAYVRAVDRTKELMNGPWAH